MNPIVNVASIFYYVFIILFYRNQIHVKNMGLVAYAIVVTFLTFAFVNMFGFQGIMTYNSYSWALANVFVVIISFFHFYMLIKNTPFDKSMKDLPMFWINTAMLIFHSGTFFVYIFADYLVNVLNDNLIVPFYIHHTFGMIFYAMLCYAMLMVRKQYRIEPATLNSLAS